jgi:hypothetical protein
MRTCSLRRRVVGVGGWTRAVSRPGTRSGPGAGRPDGGAPAGPGAEHACAAGDGLEAYSGASDGGGPRASAAPASAGGCAFAVSGGRADRLEGSRPGPAGRTPSFLAPDRTDEGDGASLHSADAESEAASGTAGSTAGRAGAGSAFADPVATGLVLARARGIGARCVGARGRRSDVARRPHPRGRRQMIGRKLVLALAGLAALVVVSVAGAAPPTISAQVSGTAGSNGWYRSTVSLLWTVVGATSFSGCQNQGAIGEPGGSFPCQASNVDGTTTHTPVVIKVDTTPPTVGGGSLAREPDANGWYNRPVEFGFSGSDGGPSGLAGCTGGTYSGPDQRGVGISGGCSDVAGNSASGGSLSFNYDATPPSVAVAGAGRQPDSNGWYNRPITFTFSGSDATSGLESCTSPTYGGPDNGSASVSGSCRDKAGNTGSGSAPVKYDGTVPNVTAVKVERPPDANGWYNHPVAITFEGQDAASGVEGCTSVKYGGPQGQREIKGTCRDLAGNVSAASPLKVRYDSKPPTLTKVAVKVGAGFARLSWRISKDTSLVRITRSPGRPKQRETVVYSRKGTTFTDKGLENGTRYIYVVSALDKAGNADLKKAAVLIRTALFSPTQGARVKAPPLLRWLPVRGATYYNVQLYRDGTKLLSAWPARGSLRLKRVWRFDGRRIRLVRGVYTWFVWPGFGLRSENRYGKLVGKSTFVVAR